MSFIESFGSNSNFALGAGYKGGKALTPIAATYVGGDVVEAATSYHFQAARLSDGTVRTVGGNNNGELGDGTHEAKASPVDPGLKGVTQLCTSSAHVLALLDSGVVMSWGGNSFGTLGNGTCAEPPGTEGNGSPVPYALSLEGVARIVAGGPNNGVVFQNGTCALWGAGMHGQLGLGVKSQVQATPAVVPGLSHVVDMAIGGMGVSTGHTLFLLSDGTVLACGSGKSGQLGNGLGVDSLAPVPVPGLTDVVEVAAGAGQSFARKSNGDLYGWGSNQRGQLGLGEQAASLTPVKILEGVSAISAGLLYSLAVQNGNVVAMGANEWGQLGDGTTLDKTTPTVLPYIGEVDQVDTGEYFSVVVVRGAEPPPPRATVTPGVGSLQIAWNAPQMASTEHWGVECYPHPKPPPPYQHTLLGSTARSYTFTGLTSGQTYDCKIQAASWGFALLRATVL